MTGKALGGSLVAARRRPKWSVSEMDSEPRSQGRIAAWRRGPQPRRILMIEDNPGDVRLTREAFSSCDEASELVAVANGTQALDYLHRRGEFADAPRPDLILLDLNLPGKDGREVLTEIKGDQELHGIPVVILSSSHDEDDVRFCYERYANCYVSKPTDFDRWHATIETLNRFWLATANLPPS